MSGVVTRVDPPRKLVGPGCPHPLMGRPAALKAKLDVAWALGPSGGGERPGALPAVFQQPRSPASGQGTHAPVSSPGAGPLVSSRPAWWLAAGHPSLHAEEDG